MRPPLPDTSGYQQSELANVVDVGLGVGSVYETVLLDNMNRVNASFSSDTRTNPAIALRQQGFLYAIV